MRRVLVVLCLTALATPAMAQFAPPRRKAGYWEMTVTMPPPAVLTAKNHLCTDAAVEAKVSAFPQGRPGEGCGPLNLVRKPKGYAFDSVCGVGKRMTHTWGTATGDFQKRYRMDVTSEESGQRTRMLIEGKRLGVCPAGKRPGDIEGPDGQTQNIAGRGPARRR